MKDYISKEDLNSINPISVAGEEIPNISLKNVLSKFKKILSRFKSKKCNSMWNSNNPNSWFWVNFFPNDNYNQKTFKKITISKNPYIKIFSTNSEGCSINQIYKNHFETHAPTARLNTFGNGLVNPQQRFLLYSVIIKGSIDPVNDINNYIDKNNLKVTKITQEQVDNELIKINTQR